MATQIAGRPLVIGDTTATPTADGKVQLQNKNGQTQTIEMAEFKEFLIANAPKANQGDTVAFNGKKGIAPEDKDPMKQTEKGNNTLLKLAGLAIATTVAIWQRKNIMKLGKGLIQKMKKIFLTPESATKKGVRTNKADKIYKDVKAKLTNTKKPEFSPETLDARLGVPPKGVKGDELKQYNQRLADLKEAFA